MIITFYLWTRIVKNMDLLPFGDQRHRVLRFAFPAIYCFYILWEIQFFC